MCLSCCDKSEHVLWTMSLQTCSGPHTELLYCWLWQSLKGKVFVTMCLQWKLFFYLTNKKLKFLSQIFLFVWLELLVSKETYSSIFLSPLLYCHPFLFSSCLSCIDSDLALFVPECFRWIPFAMLSVRQAGTVKDSQPTRCTVRRASM